MGQNPARGRSICGRISQPSVKYRQYLAWVKAIRQVASAMRSFAVRTAATRYWHHQSASHALYRCRLSLQSADTADCSSVCVHVYLLIMTVCPAQTVEPIEGDSNHALYWFLDLTTGRGTLERDTPGCWYCPNDWQQDSTRLCVLLATCYLQRYHHRYNHHHHTVSAALSHEIARAHLTSDMCWQNGLLPFHV